MFPQCGAKVKMSFFMMDDGKLLRKNLLLPAAQIKGFFSKFFFPFSFYIKSGHRGRIIQFETAHIITQEIFVSLRESSQHPVSPTSFASLSSDSIVCLSLSYLLSPLFRKTYSYRGCVSPSHSKLRSSAGTVYKKE